MADWVLVPCLASLRSELDKLAPGRDKASDGTIGDAAHASSSSDHNPDETGSTPYEDADSINEVHAFDADNDLRKSGWDMSRVTDIITTRHRLGIDDRLQNVIYDRRIWSRTWGWTPKPYNGTSPHTEHAHFSARYTTAQEQDTRPWGLLAEDDDMEPANVWTDVYYGRDEDRRSTGQLLVEARSAAVASAAGVKALAAAFAARDDVDEVALGREIGASLAATVTAAVQGAITDAGAGLTAEELEHIVQQAVSELNFTTVAKAA